MSSLSFNQQLWVAVISSSVISGVLGALIAGAYALRAKHNEYVNDCGDGYFDRGTPATIAVHIRGGGCNLDIFFLGWLRFSVRFIVLIVITRRSHERHFTVRTIQMIEHFFEWAVPII
jgi:ABC-type thiamin/hydroxymethylpyrimidine transport system permease subunit